MLGSLLTTAHASTLLCLSVPLRPSHASKLRCVEEALAARRVAEAYAIRMMGFDETTKKGNPGITSNVIIEPKKEAPLEPVVLRGAYCSAGGTAVAVSKAIEEKCFTRLRDFLTRWEVKFMEMFPDETFTGPEPSRLSMARLAGGGALQSDTCNTAEKTKQLLHGRDDPGAGQGRDRRRQVGCDERGRAARGHARAQDRLLATHAQHLPQGDVVRAGEASPPSSSRTSTTSHRGSA